MKKIITSTLLLLFVIQLSATTYFEQLCNFNFNWKKYALQAPAGEAREFSSDKELIRAHLGSVISILRNNPVEQLNVQQYNSRIQLIKVLDNYRLAGIFPMNYYRKERIPVFIDRHLTHCAVGFLLQHTGHEAMAQRIAAKNNYAWLKDIHDAEFPAWQAASGFTMEELKLIQGAYDNYRWDAFVAVDKYETPQKPACILAYFENEALHKPMAAKPDNIWCQGEGTNGVLNGKWTQNFAVGMPWIVGYFENGNRSGQWQEYYQGTKILCRTEHWRNNKLNGLRKRFDRFGNLIEEIMFKNGKAITKTNYSLEDSLVYVRKPIDSVLVFTEIFFEGSLIASGRERIHNPGNLQWFQNIELTALNSAAIQSRDNGSHGNGSFTPTYGSRSLYNTPALVEYKKEGEWKYYKEFNYSAKKAPTSMRELLVYNYRHFGQSLVNALTLFENKTIKAGYDSLLVQYDNNNLKDFYGYGNNNFIHYAINYYPTDVNSNVITLSVHRYSNYPPLVSQPVIKDCGEYNQANEKIGNWQYYTKTSKLYKKENYLIAWKED